MILLKNTTIFNKTYFLELLEANELLLVIFYLIFKMNYLFK